MKQARYKSILNIVDHLEKCIPGSKDNHSDVIITCSDGHISAHKLVLASISQLLYTEFKQNIWDETISIVTPDYSISEVTEYLQSVYSGKNLSHFSILNSLFGCFYTEKDELEVQIKEEKEDFDIGIGDCDTFENVNLDDDNHDVDEDIKTEEKVVISLKAKKEKKAIKKTKTVKDKLKKVSKKSRDESVVNPKTGQFKIKREGPKKVKDKSAIDPETGEITNPLQRSYIWNHFDKIEDDNLKKNENKFICHHCKSEFNFEHLKGDFFKTLKVHLLESHQIKFQYDEKYIPEYEIDPDTGERKKKRKTRDGYRENFVWRYFEDHPDNEVNKRKRFICQICSKVITHGGLLKHYLTHNAAENVAASCSICGKTFKNHFCRDKHERRHNLEKKFICQICTKSFKYPQSLENHMLTHTGEKPYQCNECGRQFRQPHQLKNHSRVHTGETPYECKICYKKFKFLASRNSHKCFQS